MVGASGPRIVRKHLVPHLIPSLAAYGTLMVATSIMLEIGVTFLGAGIELPTSSWGSLLAADVGLGAEPEPDHAGELPAVADRRAQRGDLPHRALAESARRGAARGARPGRGALMPGWLVFLLRRLIASIVLLLAPLADHVPRLLADPVGAGGVPDRSPLCVSRAGATGSPRPRCRSPRVGAVRQVRLASRARKPGANVELAARRLLGAGAERQARSRRGDPRRRRHRVGRPRRRGTAAARRDPARAALRVAAEIAARPFRRGDRDRRNLHSPARRRPPPPAVRRRPLALGAAERLLQLRADGQQRSERFRRAGGMQRPARLGVASCAPLDHVRTLLRRALFEDDPRTDARGARRAVRPHREGEGREGAPRAPETRAAEHRPPAGDDDGDGHRHRSRHRHLHRGGLPPARARAADDQSAERSRRRPPAPDRDRRRHRHRSSSC